MSESYDSTEQGSGSGAQPEMILKENFKLGSLLSVGVDF